MLAQCVYIDNCVKNTMERFLVIYTILLAGLMSDLAFCFFILRSKRQDLTLSYLLSFELVCNNLIKIKVIQVSCLL